MFNMHFVGKRGMPFVILLTTALWLNIALILSFGKFITTKGNIKIPHRHNYVFVVNRTVNYYGERPCNCNNRRICFSISFY